MSAPETSSTYPSDRYMYHQKPAHKAPQSSANMLIASRISLQSTPMLRSLFTPPPPQHIPCIDAQQYRINYRPETHLTIQPVLNTSSSHHNTPHNTKSASSNTHLHLHSDHPTQNKTNKGQTTNPNPYLQISPSKLSAPERAAGQALASLRRFAKPLKSSN
jgi:hypothetical protein